MPFILHVVWHPGYKRGNSIASLLLRRFTSNRYRNVVGGVGIRVIFHNQVTQIASANLAIDWNIATTVAVVVLLDRCLVNDSVWTEYVHSLVKSADSKQFNAHVIPVAMEKGVHKFELKVQTLRWDIQSDTDNGPKRLVRELTYEFSRMLRYQLKQLRHPDHDDERKLQYHLEKIEVFLSYSNHDDFGKKIAYEIRDWLHHHSKLSSFLDVQNIPTGSPFSDVIEYAIQRGALIALHTDSYSSSEWCRREVIQAKRNDVPLLVVNCLTNVDKRAFPYLGNVPIIRMNPERMDRMGKIVEHLLNEVFKNLLWRCRTEKFQLRNSQTYFTARPPELITLANVCGNVNDSLQIVYPDPPLTKEEVRLFADIRPKVQLKNLLNWLMEKRL